MISKLQKIQEQVEKMCTKTEMKNRTGNAYKSSTLENLLQLGVEIDPNSIGHVENLTTKSTSRKQIATSRGTAEPDIECQITESTTDSYEEQEEVLDEEEGHSYEEEEQEQFLDEEEGYSYEEDLDEEEGSYGYNDIEKVSGKSVESEKHIQRKLLKKYTRTKKKRPVGTAREKIVPNYSKLSVQLTGAEKDFNSTDQISSHRPYAEQFAGQFSCQCLPGFCKCRKPHWSLRKEKSPNKSFEEPEVYLWKDYECPCFHGEDRQYPSSEESDGGIVAGFFRSETKKLEICSYGKEYQQTVVMVKPDAMIFKDVIKRALLYVGGLNIVNERTLCLTPEQVSDIYFEEYYGKLSFPLFVLQMSRYPILVLSIGGLNAVKVVKSMVGLDKMIPESWFFPESIKRRIGIFADIPEAMHVSKDAEKAVDDNRYFFPESIIKPFPKMLHKAHDYCNKYINPVLNKGLAALLVKKPADPVSFLAEWLLMHNPNRPFYEPKYINLVPT